MEYISNNFKKTWIVINYLSLLFIIAIFMFRNIHNWHIMVLPTGIISISLFTGSFYYAYWIPGTWKLLHSGKEYYKAGNQSNLLRVMRYSYQVFTILTILLFFVMTLLHCELNMLIVAALIYIAHVVPSSIYRWRE